MHTSKICSAIPNHSLTYLCSTARGTSIIEWNRPRRLRLQAAQVEAAIDVYYLAGRVVEQAIGDRADGFRDVGPFAHAALREQPGRNLLLVYLLDLGDHVGPD